ncbi:uncharacterized protein EAE98_003662 [Botrytis deweyae]|uniref:Uncharacterized protein n=1 Tax=Botrytis deweyae TaxID=2478750 RepID=A0ABQ7IUZ1_9HELO|nr:uncharacterized protein EAE98_003662 [Botrytis deweyae]KAF7933953.1 hypothetical protein EAE98_003662 [Botrytis deweyae]
MNLCISSQQFDQFRTPITIILSSDARSILQRHPESKRHISPGENPKNLEAFSKPQSKERERHTGSSRENLKYGPDMTKTKLRDLDGPVKRPSRERYADYPRNEHTSVKTRPRIVDLNKKNTKVLGASLKDDNKEMMRIDEELRRNFDEVLLKSSQIKSNLERQILTTEELLSLREESETSSGDLHTDLLRYKQQLDITQKNLKKFRDIKSTIAP